MAGYYDLVLGLIPLTLAGLSFALVAAGMALTLAVPLAGLVSIGLIGHAMFVRTPRAGTRAQRSAAETTGFNSAD